jgi:hypothetical protein
VTAAVSPQGLEVASRHAALAATALHGMPTADLRCCSLHQPGEESFELYEKERDGVLGSLKRRAKIMVDALNKLEGISCQPTEGAPPARPAASMPEMSVMVFVALVSTAASCKQAEHVLLALCDERSKISNFQSCFPRCAGALYVFPQLLLPKKAVEAAEDEGKSPDFLYCRALLQEKVCFILLSASVASSYSICSSGAS